MTILENYFRKLHARYGVNYVSQAQMSEIAELFGCSIRNTRNMLNRMSENEWLVWQARAGRGRHSSLRLLMTPDMLFNKNVNEMLANQDVGKMLKFIGQEKHLLEQMIQYQFGASGEGSETRVRIPYYRDLDTLNPLRPLRRTERHLLRQCLSGLTRYDPVRMEIVPDIAHYWSHDPSYTAWEIYLKPTAMFSDGTPIRASEVKRCLDRACAAPWFSSLSRLIARIDTIGDYRLLITTKTPVKHMNYLLATQPALIFEQQQVMKCSGAFALTHKQEGFITLRRNNYYHQARPMLSEITVFTWAPKSISMSFIPVLHGDEPGNDNLIEERRLEHGSCFLMIDEAGVFAAPEARRFLNKILQPVEILDNSELPIEYGTALSQALGLLPEWNHRCVDFGAQPPTYAARRKVIIATYQQPELVQLGHAIARILKRQHFDAVVDVLPFDAFSTAQNQQADLWLTNFMINDLSPHALFDWLAPDPVFKRLPQSYIAAWQQLQFELMNVELGESKACVESFFKALTSQRWVIPLFHHWLELKSEKSFGWRDVNTLGWPDFSQLWLD